MSLINTPPTLTGYSSDNWSSYLAYLLSGGGGTPVPVSAFTPIIAATVALTVGPTATTAPVAMAVNVASVIRIRNPITSASPAAYRLATSAQAAVLPTTYTTAGTGGTVGDAMIDPGGVEVFGLSAAQQTALAAGTLYLSAITPASGSAIIYVTPGTAGL